MKKFFILFFLSISVFSHTLVLRGEKTDCLVDFSQKKVLCGKDGFSFSVDYTKDYFFVFDGKLYTVKSFLEKSGKEEDFNSSLLPCKTILPHSAQCFVSGGWFFLPVENGFRVFDVEKLKFKGEINCFFERDRTGLTIPRTVKVREGVFLVFSDRVEFFRDFKRERVFYFKNSLFFYFSAGKRFFSFMSVEKPGGIFSVKTRFLSFNYKFEKITEKELDIFPKNVFPVDGNFVFEKKEVSVFSLFGSRRIYIVKTDLKNGKFKEYSFSLSHKRRHVYPVYRGNDVCLVAQCKDGKVYFIDLKRDRVKKIDKRFYYDYVFLRGIGSGVFYNEENGDYSVVSFNFSWLGRFF